jgi:hypothetical protein
MVHATPGYAPEPGDGPNLRTLPTFSGVLELLLRAGVTTLAEAGCQDCCGGPSWNRSTDWCRSHRPLHGRGGVALERNVGVLPRILFAPLTRTFAGATPQLTR